MDMKLLRFRVTGFRSVEDSGWIDTDRITALIGTNESGKTNLLLALWKLNPAKEGEINPLSDYPRKRYNEIRSMKEKPTFITAEFSLGEQLIRSLVRLTNADPEEVCAVQVSRDFDGDYLVEFINEASAPTSSLSDILDLVSTTRTELEQLSVGRPEEPLKQQMMAALETIDSKLAEYEEDSQLDDEDLSSLREIASQVELTGGAKRSTIIPRFGQFCDTLAERIEEARKPSPSSVSEARELILNNLLSFVYYSNYGNLDSEIYLPHVIANMKREDLGSKESAKTRTLRVLFDFVRLSPEEILDLGREAQATNREPTRDEIEKSSEKKKEREILLQSASALLTQKFREWWRQGEYRIRFQADGNHFRIWVSDSRRPEEIELEGRSAGLQWFLSFYLVFLVESLEGHKGSMLLLDEPGHSLHPLAQKDLSDFFENLATTNQLIYTTHSPFLVDADHLDRVKAVFVDDHGATVVSPNLRASETKESQSRSIYPIHAALGLSVSETLLQGCQPVVVEGTSDQYYLSTIKNYLIAHGKLSPRREILFIPAGGAKGVIAVAAIVAGKDEALPHVILDSDEQGRISEKKLADGAYQGAKDKLTNTEFICGISGSEVEDLFPPDLIAKVADKYLRSPGDEELEDVLEAGKPIVPQIEAFAARSGIELRKGWKVDLATAVKLKFQRQGDPMANYPDVLDAWEKLFNRLAS